MMHWRCDYNVIDRMYMRYPSSQSDLWFVLKSEQTVGFLHTQWNWRAVNSKNDAQVWNYVLLCCVLIPVHSALSFRVTSLSLGQWYRLPDLGEATLKNMGKITTNNPLRTNEDFGTRCITINRKLCNYCNYLSLFKIPASGTNVLKYNHCKASPNKPMWIFDAVSCGSNIITYNMG